MSSVSYTNYNFQTIESLDEYNAMFFEHESDPRFISSTKETTVKFVRDLEVFEFLSAFFELLLDSFYACFKADNSDTVQRNKAWKALSRWQFVKIVELKTESVFGQNSEISNRFPEVSVSLFEELPSDLNPLIMDAFIRTTPEMSFLGVSCCVSKKWKIIFSQDILWRPFFSFLTIPKGIKIKDFLGSRSASSPEQLLEKIKKFSNSFQRDKRCELSLYSSSENLQANEEASTILFVDCKVKEPSPLRCEVLIINLPGKSGYSPVTSESMRTASRYSHLTFRYQVIPESQRQHVDKLLRDRYNDVVRRIIL